MANQLPIYEGPDLFNLPNLPNLLETDLSISYILAYFCKSAGEVFPDADDEWRRFGFLNCLVND